MRFPSIDETELIVPLHEGVFEQPMWRTFLRRLCRASGAERASMIVRSPGADGALRLDAGRGSDAGAASPGLRHLLGDDQRWRRAMREGRVYTLEEALAARGQGGPLPEDAKPRSLRAVRISAAGGAEAWLDLVADRALGAEVGSLLSALMPHLRTALRTLTALDRERTRASVGAEALSRMNFGWISLDAACGIVDMDEHAARLMRDSRVLGRGAYDRLTPASPSVDRQLTALVRAFAEDPKARPRAINLGRDPWIDILVSPSRIEAVSGETRAVAVVYLRGDRSSTADRCEQLADVFDLTPSEARLAWSMTQGLTIAEAATANGLTVETARNYSKKIYAKTGARGQVDLVRHVLTGVLAMA